MVLFGNIFEENMPLKEYICLKCSNMFEVLELISNKKKTKCPKCNSIRVNSLISKSTFHLKGEGWYKDGYQKGKGKNKK